MNGRVTLILLPIPIPVNCKCADTYQSRWRRSSRQISWVNTFTIKSSASTLSQRQPPMFIWSWGTFAMSTSCGGDFHWSPTYKDLHIGRPLVTALSDTLLHPDELTSFFNTFYTSRGFFSWTSPRYIITHIRSRMVIWSTDPKLLFYIFCDAVFR